MKIAITGGRGFIGGAVLEQAIAAGHQAWSFDTQSGRDICGDLGLLEGAQTVVHCAGVLGTAELFDRAEEAIRVNVTGTLRVMQWCVDNNAGFVGITMPPVFPSVYTATRVCTAHLGRAYQNAYGLRCSWVEAYNAYGARQRYGAGHPQKIVPTFATLGWQGRPLPVWGDGEQMVDLVHADDVARMLLDATQYGGGHVFDAGTGVSFTVNQVARFVNEVTGNRAGIQYLPMRKGEIPTQIHAEGRGWGILGWHPEMDWDRVAEVVRSYRV